MEYPDAINPNHMTNAVSLTLDLLLQRDEPLAVLAAEAVSRTFCTCVTAGEDAAEGRLSVIHAKLIEAVIAQVSQDTAHPAKKDQI